MQTFPSYFYLMNESPQRKTTFFNDKKKYTRGDKDVSALSPIDRLAAAQAVELPREEAATDQGQTYQDHRCVKN